MKSKIIITIFIVFLVLKIKASKHEFLPDTAKLSQELKFKYSALIIPTVLIGYGVVGIESDGLKLWNTEINEELHENIDKKITIDDFSQYAPFLSVYGLNAIGIKGKNNFKERTIILATSYLIMGSTVTGLKSIT